MKTKILSLAILSLWSMVNVFAQDRTTVTASNSDISDNLDLRAVASIFGDSRDLDDFERRLNDPQSQISNLDLNGDNRVDYLRVIETVEGNVHLIVIQSVLGQDTFQDIATVEVEKDRNNRVQVQVVGDVYMYGNNYIYEPVYAYTPVIYTSFWVRNYRPYYSSWYWNYYPSFYIAWNPFPIYTYHSHIGVFINHHHHYNYVNYRRCGTVYNNYYAGRRGNGYERQYPNRSFAQRNTGFTNRRELVSNRRTESSNVRGNATTRTTAGNVNTRNAVGNANTRSAVGNGNTRGTTTVNSSNEVRTVNNGNVRNSESPRTVSIKNGSASGSSPRSSGNTRNTDSPRTIGSNGNTRISESPRSVASQGNTRSYESPRNAAPRSESQTMESPRSVQRSESPRSSGQRDYSQQRGNSQRSEGNVQRSQGSSSRGGNEGNSRGNRRS